jgi:hypothetical protein
MKTFIATAIVMALSALGSSASACGSLQGAWELTYAVYKDANGKVMEEVKNGSAKSLKILTNRHFSFITQDKDGHFLFAGAGTWSVKGNEYTEVVTYSSSKDALGKTYTFKCELRDGVWIHSGHEDQLLIEEHWQPAK